MPSFAHALRLAVASNGALEIVDLRNARNGSDVPSVQKTLEQWRLFPDHCGPGEKKTLGLRVKKTREQGQSRKEIGKRLDNDAPDLLVIGTQSRRRIGHLFGQDFAEHLAHSHRQTTLYLPTGVQPFVDPKTGRLSLDSILVPVANTPPIEPTFAFLRRLLTFLPEIDPTITGLHAGDLFP
ncbi:MAG: hypothetical protein GF344_19080, partial [Chitinivibrionales bacterium]|nr:hypothetical protein [Chitinivibrionales bacterium]MBD3358729.1 hypothetical protein [Chitinivibrionales bacterium]